MNYKANYNNVIDDLRNLGFNKRTKWTIQADGSKRGEGFYVYEDPNMDRRTGTFGTCVRENLITYMKLHKAGAKFYQGEMRSRMCEWAKVDENRGMPVYHCWVELGDKVYDYSNGTKMVADTDLFYLMRRVKKAEQVRVEIKETKIGSNISLQPEIDEEQRTIFYKKIKKAQRKLGYYAEK
jgi:uncharacterized protein YqgV (UPF0045/DUF77 family)